MARHRYRDRNRFGPSWLMDVGQQFSILLANTELMFVGDSMTYASGGQLWHYPWWLIAACDGIFDYPQTVSPGTASASGGNMGVSGDDTSDLVARKATIASAVGGNAVIIAVGENDGVGVTAQDMIDNVEEVIAALDAGATVFIMPIAYTSTVDGSGTLQSRKTTYDAYWAAHDRVIFLENAWSGISLHDSTHSVDGIHQTSLGAKLQAENIAPYIIAAFEADKTAYDAPYINNLIPEAQRDYSAGWSITNSTGASVAQSNGTLGGETSKIFTISGTPTAADTFRYRNTITTSITNGDEVVGMTRISITNAAQDGPPVGLDGFWFTLFFGQASWGTLTFSTGRGLDDAIVDESFVNQIIRTNSENATATGSALTYDISARLDTSGPCDIRIEISQPAAFNKTVEGV